jgi:hypothetical protein
MIEATINGEGPFHFIVDTGTSDEAVFFGTASQEASVESNGRIGIG